MTISSISAKPLSPASSIQTDEDIFEEINAVSELHVLADEVLSEEAIQRIYKSEFLCHVSMSRLLQLVVLLTQPVLQGLLWILKRLNHIHRLYLSI